LFGKRLTAARVSSQRRLNAEKITDEHLLWNTVYLERTIQAMRESGHKIDDALLQYLSPLGWEHINQSRQLVGSGRDGLGLVHACAHAPVVRTQCRLARTQGR
jgi:hypothetical protein